MSFQPSRWSLCLVILMAPLGEFSASEPHYRMEVLPAPPGCNTSSILHGLGRHDRVLGLMSCDENVTFQAVMWKGDVLVELGTFGGPNSLPYAIDPRGAVVGTADRADFYAAGEHVTRPFRFDGGALHDLGTLGGPIGAALAVNSEGTIVGGCQAGSVEPHLGHEPMRACVWTEGEVRDLGDLGGPEAAAYDISGRGWIAGNSDTAEELPSGLGPVEHAFLHDGHTMRDLGTLGGPFSLATALNERGDVVGFSLTGQPQPSGLPPWHAFLWQDGALHDLGTLGGAFSEAWGINDAEQVVGSSWRSAPAGNNFRHAALWQGGTIVDLNDAVENLQGWSLTEATAIDDRGRILATAQGPGHSRVVVLTPAMGN
jgi:probable HAF family extracellular repeat protein